ncbi:hypothetical protein [Methylocaldum sp.]|uniref:hypothetical protein n=1 Tax=Methylocaldum sp. TaxID=1969727 RepID=UPI002D59113A|nr:hypothetical protein [Methylocaldum sp.]HYE36145.1 hypothetical protein [Methylocaldum sp.]
MKRDLATALPALLPRAVAWAEVQSQQALRYGTRLNSQGSALASRVGVQRPEHIRVAIVAALPFPEDPELRAAALETGLLGPGMVGLTLGYAVFVCQGHEADSRLLSHEFRHVYQYEAAGSIQQFLPVYLSQMVEFGYEHAPLEVDARAHEILYA